MDLTFEEQLLSIEGMNAISSDGGVVGMGESSHSDMTSSDSIHAASILPIGRSSIAEVNQYFSDLSPSQIELFGLHDDYLDSASSADGMSPLSPQSPVANSFSTLTVLDGGEHGGVEMKESRSDPVVNKVPVSQRRSFVGTTSVQRNKQEKVLKRASSTPALNFRISSEAEETSRRRNRTNPEQLMVLEEAFLRNPNLTNQIRDSLSERINMSPKSIRIWFQNRRAKDKRRSSELSNTGLITPPPQGDGRVSPYRLISPQPRKSPNAQATSPPVQNVAANESSLSPSSFTIEKFTHFPIARLEIGTWKIKPFTFEGLDLTCTFDIARQLVSYTSMNETGNWKIEFPIGVIALIELQFIKDAESILSIQLNRPPFFYSCINSSENAPMWNPCLDFTDQQATLYRAHTIRIAQSNMLTSLLGFIRSDVTLRRITRFRDTSSIIGLRKLSVDETSLEILPQKSMLKSQSVPALPDRLPSDQTYQLPGAGSSMEDLPSFGVYVEPYNVSSYNPSPTPTATPGIIALSPNYAGIFDIEEQLRPLPQHRSRHMSLPAYSSVYSELASALGGDDSYSYNSNNNNDTR